MLYKFEGSLLLTPCPTLLVTSRFEHVDNVFTVAWAGIASSKPEYVTISINPKRYSYKLISRSKKFCINIPGSEMIKEVDYCGNHTGLDTDKFLACKFTKEIISDFVLIKQCRFHVLCNVEHEIDLGNHHLFIARVLEKYSSIEAAEQIHDKLHPIVYYRPYYYEIGENNIGNYGFTLLSDNQN